MSWRDGIGSVLAGWKMLLFVLLSLLVLFLISLQGYVVSKQSTKTIEEQYYRTIVENMDSLSVNLSNYLNYIDDFARALSNNPDLLNVLQTGGDGAKRKAEEQIRLFSEYYHLRLPVNVEIISDRQDVFAYPSINLWEERRLKEIVATFPWFEHRIALDNSFLHWNVAADFHRESSSNVLYVSKNIIRDNRSYGLLVMELNGILIERMLNRAQIHEDNPIAVFSGDMQTLFHNEGFPAKLSEDGAPLRDVYRMVKARNQDQGSVDVRMSGTDYRVLFKQIASTPWTMVSLIPPELLHTDSVSIWRITAVMTALSLLFVAIFFAILYTKVTLPVHQLSRIVRTAGEGRTPSPYSYKGFREIETLSRGIFQFLGEIQEQFQTIKRGESEKRKLELQMLQERMRPHFWHNSLNSLRFLAMLQGDRKMSEALLSLSRMLDYTLKNTEVLYSTLEEEKEYAMSFVRFQEIRSMQRLSVQLDLDEPSLQARIPKFTLQPLLENAILHGFAPPFDREPQLRVAAGEESGMLVLRVWDNGNGMEADALKRLFRPDRQQERRSNGISLINLQQRFRLEYGEPYGIRVESEASRFTQVTVSLPYRTAGQEREGNER